MRVLLVLLSGCGPANAVIADSSDTDVVVDTDVDTEPDTDSAPPPPDASWEGEREFWFPSILGAPCDAEVDEIGVAVTDDPDWAEAVAACTGCDDVYLVEVAPGAICPEQVPGGQGFQVPSPILRGLDFHGAAVTIYDLGRQFGAYVPRELAVGVRSGDVITYEYEGSIFGAAYTATGYVELD